MAARVVIAGRPNVGKSTLFNRLAGRRAALVADEPGMTRDVREVEAEIEGRRVVLADTAGLEEAAPESLADRMRAGAESAMMAADLILFVIDARAGLLPSDRHFAKWLRRCGRKVLLVANKAEGRQGAVNAAEAYELGLGDPLAVSAEHGEGFGDLVEAIAAALPPLAEGESEEDDGPLVERPLRLAILGRPNAGKSTLLNRLLGAERMLTGPEPGITRDAITVRIHDAEGPIDLVDTAGLRRRARITEAVEQAAVGSAIGALRSADVVALTIDAAAGLHDQDLQLARLTEREGRSLVLVLNKWDAVAERTTTRQAIADRVETSLAQVRGLPVVTISALTGAGAQRLLPAVRQAAAIWNTRVGTSALNRWFEHALERHPPPLVEGRRLKLRYITQAKARPPTFVLFGTRAEKLPETYQRYLVNGLREEFSLPGTPIRILLRGTDNPYVDNK